ncbi:MAG: transketolase [Candidatus Moranbacteria bacterium]|nr:transketolase [Candidatus Moranbacteria bacterium]
MNSKDQNTQEIARLMRRWIVKMTTKAGSGHPTSSLSATDLMAVLFFKNFFLFDTDNPENKNNDRLIFSKGHASPLFYALWTAAGQIEVEDLEEYRVFNSFLEGHPTRRFSLTEAPTGSLGQGLSIGLGMALAAKNLDKSNSLTYVLLGDSEMAEGSVWEAMQLASYYKLDNLVGIIDVNRLGQRGETMLGDDTDTYQERCEAFGWNVIVINGHDHEEITNAYAKIKDENKTSNKPTMIIAKTIKGKGVSFLEDKDDWHGKVLSEQECAQALEEIGGVDEKIRDALKKPGMLSQEKRKEVKRTQDSIYSTGEKVSTRDSYGNTLRQIIEDERVVVLDAEVGNSTRSEKAKEVCPERFFEMFIAEQNMVGVAIGLARRGWKPFVSTFAAFFTRAADQIRMAQYAQVPIVFVGSHAGVSIGQDGASQMGLEDIALFRTKIGATVLCPADAVATQSLANLALEQELVTYIRTAREKTLVIYNPEEEFVVGGSKTLRNGENDQATIIATGVAVFEALKAHDMLKEGDVDVRVIDAYSIKPLDKETIITAAKQTKNLIVVEDHYEAGGLGEVVMKTVTGTGATCEHLCVRKTPCSGAPEELRAYEEIDANAIVKKVKEFINKE